MQLLIAKGARMDEENNDGQTPLHLAALRANLAAIKELLILDAKNVNKQDSKGNTCLHLAACPTRHRGHKENEEVVKELLRQNVDLKKENQDGKTPLDVANESRNKAIADILSKA